MPRYFWLSFADSYRFLGAAIVTLDEEDIEEAAAEVAEHFPHARAGAEVVAAATMKAHLMGCNPGGEVCCTELDPARLPPEARLHRLLQREELAALGLIP
jgi:hypothetical protein